MSLIIYFADHALWITLLGAICSVAVKFETILPIKIHKFLLYISLFISLATPLLGFLKKDLDDKWKFEIQRQVEAIKVKPLNERLTIMLNSFDKGILLSLAKGNTKFSGKLTQAQFTDLQRISSEQGASSYISFKASPNMIFSKSGQKYPCSFELNPSLIEKKPANQ